MNIFVDSVRLPMNLFALSRGVKEIEMRMRVEGWENEKSGIGLG